MGAVLAGGRSSRFGRDKRQVVVDGQTMLEHARAVLAVVCDEVLVCGDGGDLSDVEAGGGPLQALIAVLRAARTRGHTSVIAIACDMPRLDEATLRALAAPMDSPWLARVPRTGGGHLQVLCARWSITALEGLEAAWMAGERSLTRALAGMPIEVRDDFDAMALVDVDTPEDLARVVGVGPVVAVEIDKNGSRERDWVAREEPLEIVVDGAPLAVLLRTPAGSEADLSLAAGFLLAEGIIDRMSDLDGLAPCRDPAAEHRDNRVLVTLAAGVTLPESAHRAFVTSASCGLCGKTTIDSLLRRLPVREGAAAPRAVDVHAMDAAVRRQQAGFATTGALHAAALFDGATLLAIAEDVGRHNAVDKVFGAALRRGELPLRGKALWVSGRVSFELVQKALLAGVDALVAVGAPTSMAIELAREGGLHLLGFVRGGRANVYAGEIR